MRVFNLTTSQFALSNIALRRLKVARFNDLNDPFELLAVDVAARDLRAGMRAKRSRSTRQRGSCALQGTGAAHSCGVTTQTSTEAWRSVLKCPTNSWRPCSTSPECTRSTWLQSRPNRRRSTTYSTAFGTRSLTVGTYEGEVRQFFRLKSSRGPVEPLLCAVLSELLLREVILGPRCDVPIEAVRDLVQHFPVKVHVTQARIAFTKFGVVEDRRYRAQKS